MELSANFCPVEYIMREHRFIGVLDGGYPVFNFDGRSDTPSFIPKYQVKKFIIKKIKEREYQNYENLLLRAQTSSNK